MRHQGFKKGIQQPQRHAEQHRRERGQAKTTQQLAFLIARGVNQLAIGIPDALHASGFLIGVISFHKVLSALP